MRAGCTYGVIALDAYAAPVVSVRGAYKGGAVTYREQVILGASSTASYCARLCLNAANDAGCFGFSFDAQTKTCTMHTEIGEGSTHAPLNAQGWSFYKKHPYIPTATPLDTTVTDVTTEASTTEIVAASPQMSAVKKCFAPLATVGFIGGHALAMVTADMQTCYSLCWANPKCGAFHYSAHDNICGIKTARGTPTATKKRGSGSTYRSTSCGCPRQAARNRRR